MISEKRYEDNDIFNIKKIKDKENKKRTYKHNSFKLSNSNTGISCQNSNKAIFEIDKGLKNIFESNRFIRPENMRNSLSSKISII